MILRANREIGTGHLMRVKSVVQPLKAHALIKLYVYAFDEALRPMCADFDEVYTFKTKEEILDHLLTLPERCADSNRCDNNDNNDKICSSNAASTEFFPEVLVIDDYAIDKSFEQPLAARAKIFVIDDLFDRDHDCDMLLDQTLITHQEEYEKRCPPHCTLLLGAKYSLTNPKFYPQNYALDYQSPCSCGSHYGTLSYRAYIGKDEAAHNSARTSTTEIPTPARVFISFGGADPVSACLTLTHTIVRAKLYQHYAFTFLAGAANKDYEATKEAITAIPSEYQSNFTLLRHCSDVADLLFKNDVAIGAYGGMFRERIAAGIPTAGVIIADNQKGADTVVDKYKLGLNLGLEELNDENKVQAALDDLITHAATYTQNCFTIYDGHGLERIVSAIASLLHTEQQEQQEQQA